jgi:hypothetical protein
MFQKVDTAQKTLIPIRAEIVEAKETIKREEAAVDKIKANKLQTAFQANHIHGGWWGKQKCSSSYL